MNNLIDIKKAYETTEFLDELFDRFEITNSNGEFDEYFSEINPTSLKTKLYAPTKKGYTFKGWYVNNGKKKVTSIKTKKAIKVTAKWQKVKKPGKVTINAKKTKASGKKITVKYKDTETTEPSEIEAIGDKLDDFKEYEIILDYDSHGFVNSFKIVEK